MENKSIHVKKWAFTALSISLITVIVYLYLLNTSEWHSSSAELGAVGDFFGGILNPIFAFLSFIFLIVTIGLQVEELKESRKQTKASTEELKLTREEMEKSSEALTNQAKVLKIQLFETTYFNLVKIYRDSIENLGTNVGNNMAGPLVVESYFNQYLENKDKLTLSTNLTTPLNILRSINTLILDSFKSQNLKNKYFSIILSSITVHEIYCLCLLRDFINPSYKLNDLTFLNNFGLDHEKGTNYFDELEKILIKTP